MIVYTDQPQSFVGLFAVWKKDRSQRLIVDARATNPRCQVAPRMCLGSTAALGLVDLSDEELRDVARLDGEPPGEHRCGAGGFAATEVVGSSLDVKDGFHQFEVHEMAPWLAMADPGTAAAHGTRAVWDGRQNRCLEADPAETVWPCVATMSMGWSWALYFCHAAVEYAVAGAAGVSADRAVREHHPDPRFSVRQPVTCTCVDNVGLMEGRGAESVFGSLVQSFHNKDIQVHEVREGLVQRPHLGAVFEGQLKVLRHTPERIWCMYLAGNGILRKKRLSGAVLRVWVGHLAWLVHVLTLTRPALASLVVCYKFMTAAGKGRKEVWPSLRREIRVVCGLLILSQVRLGLLVAPIAYGSDSSDFGYCLSVTQVDVFEAAAEMKFRERWRFRVESRDDGLALTS